MNNQWQPEFLDDPSFVQWALGTDQAAIRKWDLWIEAHPEWKEEVHEAAELVRAMEEGERDSAWTRDRQQAHWQRIQATLAQQLVDQPATPNTPVLEFKRASSFWRKYGVAAAILLLLGTSAGLYWSGAIGTQEVVLLAKQGQSESVFLLPDGTTVSLNQASTLRYTEPRWGQDWEREVWVNGEAFFDVTKTPNKDQFEVHTDALTITVLGTRFNVRNQSGVQDVVLEEGKVRLTLNESSTQDSMVLLPGERAILQSSAENAVAQLVRDTVNVLAYTSWREGYFLVDDLTLADVILRVEEVYGWEFILEDSSLLYQKMKGRLPIQDAVMMETILSRMLGVTWEQQGNQVRLKAR